MAKPLLKIEKTGAYLKKEQHQSKLAALADKKKQGKWTLEDVDEKLDVILEMLEELLRK